MIKYVDHNKIGYNDHGWLKTYHHFSFSNYYNLDRMGFGVLRVVNDDIINAHTGFSKHPHKDMEIISYIVEGELTHGDSMGHEEIVSRGQVQYISAGAGVYHSEYNNSDENVRLFQIWIEPDRIGYPPNYGDFKFEWDSRVNKWLHLVTGSETEAAPVKVHQDVNIYITALDALKKLTFEVRKNRQAYVIQIEGRSLINHLTLKSQDALEVKEDILNIEAKEDSHIMVIEMEID